MRKNRTVFLAVILAVSVFLTAACCTETETRKEVQDFLDEEGQPDFEALQEVNPEAYALSLIHI